MNRSTYKKRLAGAASQMPPDSAMLLIASEEKVRNANIMYSYRAHSDLIYLTGFNAPCFALFLDSSGEIQIFFTPRNDEKARWEGEGLTSQAIANVLEIDKEKQIHPYENLWETLKKLLKNKETLYFSFGESQENDQKVINAIKETTIEAKKGDFAPTRLVYAKEILQEMRLIKKPEEIAILKKAAQISAEAHNRLMQYCREKISEGSLYEYEIKAFIEWQFQKSYQTEIAYPTIAAAGNNATILHYTDLSSAVRKDDLALVDAGCEIAGYASDITRTFPVSGKFTPVQKSVYEVVLAANKNAIFKCVSGENLDSVHSEAVKTIVDGLLELGLFKKFLVKKDGKSEIKSSYDKNEIIENEYYRVYYMHNTSHFLGLDVHDSATRYINHKPRMLEQGMVFTIEPGIYLPKEYDFLPNEFKGIGIRIEDDILFDGRKGENLSIKALKEISELES
ncbi:MAG: aminopeptidase P N-terminal domain-containing protein [Spirochaetia bacterium]|nr:aminopeptidase P N-terminal domain-containing protein [Spirochaetia bacterium]